jgi:hypothetical protein
LKERLGNYWLKNSGFQLLINKKMVERFNNHSTIYRKKQQNYMTDITLNSVRRLRRYSPSVHITPSTQPFVGALSPMPVAFMRERAMPLATK